MLSGTLTTSSEKMAKILDIITSRAAQAAAQPQSVQAGVVLGTDVGRYRISVAGHTTLAECGVQQRLKTGDRVWVVVGLGTSKIIGVLGRDESDT